jgi:hypothetical protein
MSDTVWSGFVTPPASGDELGNAQKDESLHGDCAPIDAKMELQQVDIIGYICRGFVLIYFGGFRAITRLVH